VCDAQVNVQRTPDDKTRSIAVNVPTRWATNYLVLKSVLGSRKAITAAASDPRWVDIKAEKGFPVQAWVTRAEFWAQCEALSELLAPFSDAIYRIEGDKPYLADCHVVLKELEQHVKQWVQTYCSSQCGIDTSRTIPTFMRRLEWQQADTSTSTSGSDRPSYGLAPIYNVAYTASYMLDPFHGVYETTTDDNKIASA
jgi:hypothetical protein